MRKAAFAGALVLAMMGSSLAVAGDLQASSGQVAERSEPSPTLTHVQIAHFRSVLRLRPEQERYWPAVARVLSGMVRQASSGHSGLVQRMSARVYDIASDTVGLHRLATAARPLVESLDSDQKVAALQFVNDMGYGAVVAAF